MRLPFHSAKEDGPKLAELPVNLYFSYITSVAKLTELTERRAAGADTTELRAEALHRARRAAYLNHAAFKAVMYLGLREELPEEWLPVQALGAFARVIYGLVAIAEDPPETEALLTAEELQGLADQYDIVDWLWFWRRQAQERGPDLTSSPPDPGPRSAPVTDATQTLRAALLDDSGTDPVFEADARFLIARQEAAAGLLLDHAELFELIHARYEESGPSPELEALTVEAAGNLATVLQSLRRRQDLLNLLIADADVPAVPMALIDQLLFSFVLLTGPRNERYLHSVLPTPDIEMFIRSPAIQDWMDRLDPRELFDEPPGARHDL